MSDGCVLMSITFTVKDPVSTNAMYRRRGGPRVGFFITEDGKRFKLHCAHAALVARQKAGWPSDLYRVAKARVSYQLWNYKGDVDGVAKPIRDSLEGMLYLNDRIVEDGAHPLPLEDAGGRRVVVIVDLLKMRTVAEAAAERAAAAERERTNAQRRAKARAKRAKRSAA